MPVINSIENNLDQLSAISVVEYLLERLTTSVTEPVIEIKDQTSVLASSLSDLKKRQFQAKEWMIIPYKSVIDLRRRVWESKPSQMILILPKDANRTALADLLSSRHSQILIADSASILNGLAEIDLSSDNRLTPLLPHLIDRIELLKQYYRDDLRQSELPAFILSVLLDSDLGKLATCSTFLGKLATCPTSVFVEQELDHRAAAIFAQIAQGTSKLPKESEPFIAEYISAFPKEWQNKLGRLLRFSGNRSNVIAELLKAYIQFSSGKLVSADPALKELIGEEQGQKRLQEWAECIREALFAAPSWGKMIAGKADTGNVRNKIDYLQSSLKHDIKKQVKEIVNSEPIGAQRQLSFNAAPRKSLDSEWWNKHFFASEMSDGIKAAKEISTLMDVLSSISEMTEDAEKGDLGKRGWTQWYSETGAYGDLLWMRLKEQIPKVPWLASDITEVMKCYQNARSKLNRLFAKELVENYKIWFNGKDVSTVANILTRFVKPNLQENRVLLLIIDGLNYPVWRNIISDILKYPLSLSEEPVLSLLPTVTGVGRHAIFAGMSPKNLYPHLTYEEQSQSGEEKSLIKNIEDRKIAFFRKRHLNEQFAEVNSTIADDEIDLVCVITNEVDDALKAHSGNLTKGLDDLTYVSSLIKSGIDANRTLIIASDHGFTPDGSKKVKLEGVNVKDDFDRFAIVAGDVREEGVIVAKELLLGKQASSLSYGNVALLTDFGARLKYPHNGYHGGASLEEVIVPCAVIRAGETAQDVVLSITFLPWQVSNLSYLPEVVEDSDVSIILQVQTKGAPIENLAVELLLPGETKISFTEKLLETGSWVKWEANWKPTLPLPKEVEAPKKQKATIRARLTSPAQLSNIETSCDTMIIPKRGKTTRSVDDFLSEF